MIITLDTKSRLTIHPHSELRPPFIHRQLSASLTSASFVSDFLCVSVPMCIPITPSHSAAFTPPCSARSSFCSCRVFGWIEKSVPDVFLWTPLWVLIAVGRYSSVSIVCPLSHLRRCWSCSVLWKVWPQRGPLVKQQPVAATDKWGYGHFACLICVCKLHLMNRTPTLNDRLSSHPV